jgi:hypothetical protein
MGTPLEVDVVILVRMILIADQIFKHKAVVSEWV